MKYQIGDKVKIKSILGVPDSLFERYYKNTIFSIIKKEEENFLYEVKNDSIAGFLVKDEEIDILVKAYILPDPIHSRLEILDL